MMPACIQYQSVWGLHLHFVASIQFYRTVVFGLLSFVLSVLPSFVSFFLLVSVYAVTASMVSLESKQCIIDYNT